MNKWIGCVLGLLMLGIFSSNVVWADEGEVLAALKTISGKQDQILADLENIKTELNIVKVRTTLNG